MGAAVAKDNVTLRSNPKGLSITDYLPGFVTHHCAMIGLDSSGKTTLLYRLKFDQYVNATPTIGFNCEKIRFNGTSFMVWDAGGQDKLRPLWRSYTRCTDGIVFVVDSSKGERLEEARLELLNICKSQSGFLKVGKAAKKSFSALRGSRGVVPVMVLANKQDLPSAMEAERVEAMLGLKELGPKGTAWDIQSTCAVTGEGLDEAMLKLVAMIEVRKGWKNGKRSLKDTIGYTNRTTTLVNNCDKNSTASSSLSSSPSDASSSSAGSRIRQTAGKGLDANTRRVRRSHSHVR